VSIRVRLILVMLLVWLVPIALALFAVNRAMGQVNDLAISSTQVALEEMGRAAIRDKALATARQIELYLRYNPNVDPFDAAALEADTELAALAVQPVGRTGYTAVFDDKAVTHFHVNPELIGQDLSTQADDLPEFWAILSASLNGSPAEGYYDWEDADGFIRRKFMATAPVANTPLRVAATTYIEEFTEIFQPVRQMKADLEQMIALTRGRFILLALAVGLIGSVLVGFIGIQFIAPLRQMAVSASRVVEGEWEAIQPSNRRDELGTLSRALYAMTRRVQGLVQGLEQQVADRTADLEQRAAELQQLTRNLENALDQSRRRALRLEASAQVARAVASVLDPERLLQQVVKLIADQMGLYHVGAFLLDETDQYAVLRAASSEGGQRMVVQGYRLRVGVQDVIGYAVSTGRPRVALDIGTDTVHFINPELPYTRSEMALPLTVRGQIIGVLDVQSAEPKAFDSEDVKVLQTLADQIAVALDNARLFEESRESLQEMRAVQAQYIRQAWRAFAAQQKVGFFEYTRVGVTLLDDLSLPDVERAIITGELIVANSDGQTPASLIVPLTLYSQTIGVLGFQETESGRVWTKDEVALVEAAAEQLVQALESARLFKDAQLYAWREQAVGRITSRVRVGADVESILQTAAEELGRTLGVSRAIIRLDVGSNSPSDGH
jgi:GAF domain-containing protein/HAMP domain-containing protein